jgi:hypothetical protein
MLDVTKALPNPTVLRALTGLNPDEFSELAQTLAQCGTSIPTTIGKINRANPGQSGTFNQWH